MLVDISVDQVDASSRPARQPVDPVFRVDDSLFYCVANMPGAVPHSSTHALANATLPYTLEFAANGWRAAVRDDPSLALGVNVAGGQVVYRPVAEAHGLEYTPLDRVL